MRPQRLLLPPLDSQPSTLNPGWYRLPLAAAAPASIAGDPVAYLGQDYGGPHETVHLLNSRVRNWAGPGWNAAYQLRGRIALLREPAGVTLSDVARAVPEQYRGPQYQLYMVSQAGDWERQPLYVLDEASAYLAGWECHAAAGDAVNSHHSARCAAEMLDYARVLSTVAKARGNDVAVLDDVIEFMVRRLRGQGANPQSPISNPSSATTREGAAGSTEKLPSTVVPPPRVATLNSQPPTLNSQPTPAAGDDARLDRLRERLVGVEQRADKLVAILQTDGTLRGEVQQLGARVDELDRLVPAIHQRAEDAVGLVGAKLPALRERLEAVESRAEAAPGVDRVREVSREVAVELVTERLPTLGQTSLSAGLVALGISAPVAGVLGWLGYRGARRLVKRAKSDLAGRLATASQTGLEAPAQTPPPGPTSSTPTPQSPTSQSGFAQAPAAQSPVIIREQSPPPPQVTVRDREFVQIEVPTKRQRGLELAMDEYVRRFPGARDVIETLEAFSRQYESGISQTQ